MGHALDGGVEAHTSHHQAQAGNGVGAGSFSCSNSPCWFQIRICSPRTVGHSLIDLLSVLLLVVTNFEW